MASGTHPTVFSGRVHKPHTRGGGNADKASNRRMQSFARPVCGSLISATQEERDFSPSVQFETSERIRCLSTLQNGGGADAYVNDPDTRLDDDNRPQRCIFLRPYSRKTSQISPVSLEREALSIQIPPVRSEFGTENFLQAPETSSSSFTKVRCEAIDFPGQHHTPESKQNSADHRQELHTVAPTKARICHKLGQISYDKSTANTVFGLYDRLQDHDASSSGGENHGNPGQMPGSIDDGDGLSQTIIRIDRDTHRIGYGRAHSAITLPTIANVEVKGTFNRRSELQHQNPTDPRSQNGDEMVDTLSRSIEWQSHHHTSTRPDHNNRFLDEGLGCSMQQCDNTRSVEHPGTEITHKCIGIESSNVCTESICQNRQNKPCAFTSGQHHNSCTDQQDGRNVFPKAFSDNSRIMAVLHIKADHSYCRTSSGSPKRDCGQGVESFSRSECMETIEYNTSANRTGIGHDRRRPVCRSLDHTKVSVYQLETRPWSHGDRCIQCQMECNECICISTFLSHREMPSQGQEGPSRPAHHNASVASSTVVSNAPRNADRTTNIVTTNSEHFDVTSRRVTSIGDNEQPTTSCMEDFGENLVSKGFSRESSKLLSESRRPGTQLAYAGPWKKWCRW